MKIRILGAHNMESRDTRIACALIDNTLAIDAGGLISSLTFEEQQHIKSILLTHHHYDHIKDIPLLGLRFQVYDAKVTVYSIAPVHNALKYLFSFPGELYPNVLEKPAGNPPVRFITVEPLEPFEINGYRILPVPVNHSVPAVGFQITSPEGNKLFYSGDTGPGLEECWQHISPELLIIECTASDKYIEEDKYIGHLSPGLLKKELISFRKIKGYIPQVITTHQFADKQEEAENKEKLEQIASELNASITTGYEGMQIIL